MERYRGQVENRVVLHEYSYCYEWILRLRSHSFKFEKNCVKSAQTEGTKWEREEHESPPVKSCSKFQKPWNLKKSYGRARSGWIAAAYLENKYVTAVHPFLASTVGFLHDNGKVQVTKATYLAEKKATTRNWTGSSCLIHLMPPYFAQSNFHLFQSTQHLPVEKKNSTTAKKLKLGWTAISRKSATISPRRRFAPCPGNDKELLMLAVFTTWMHLLYVRL